MIKFNIFSGRVYTETPTTKQSDTGDTFVKCGSNWFGTHGEVIQDRGHDLFNINTGISSTFGDPFKDDK